MISWFCFALCMASTALCANTIDQATLQSVFGQPSPFAAQASDIIPMAQAMAVTPESDTLTDPDYWDVDTPPTASVHDNDKFEWTLTKRVASTMDSNMLLSPLGLKLALAILAEAATGPTKSELELALGFDLDRNVVRRQFTNIINSLQKHSPKYVLNLGSKVYVDNTVHPRQMYAAIAKQFYNTDITPIDFHNAPAAAKTINDWCANITEGRINNLVSADDVAQSVVLILNTLFFKGSWRHQFAPNATKPAGFYATPKIQKTVPFMNVKDKFYFTESVKYDAKIVRMPYQGNKFAMYIVVPNSLTGMNYVLNRMTQMRFEMQNMTERLVDITLPKWNFEYTSELEGALQDLGVREAFLDSASFPGIARGQTLQQRLKVSKVLQRCGIEVNELGSVAYSATEIELVNKFGEDDDIPVEVKANRPFFFFIQDDVTRQALFTGIVADPSQGGELKLS